MKFRHAFTNAVRLLSQGDAKPNFSPDGGAKFMRVVVIGAGIGGLTVGALLARAGLSVTVLEASEHPGGCASTFEVDGFRFDVGATVAGGFAPDGPMTRLAQWLDICWDAHPVEPAMVVHLPDGFPIVRWSDSKRWRRERLKAFGEVAEPFWRWQEYAAEVLWSLAVQLPPWLPQTSHEVFFAPSFPLRYLDKLSVQFSVAFRCVPNGRFSLTQRFVPPSAIR